MSGLRYRAIGHALRSLVSPLHFVPVEPSERGVPYRPRAPRGVRPLADLYVPSAPNGAAVVLVHGGGFVLGTRGMKPMRFLATRLMSAGIAACAVDYRLIFRGGRLEESLDDVRAALGYLGSRARGLGLDEGRISLVGLSAGGTLCLLAAAREPSVHAVVSCFGAVRLDHTEGRLAALLPRLLLSTSDPRVWAARFPRGAAQPSMPTLLLHGDDDGLVPVQHARELAAYRSGLGLPTRLVVYEGAPHGFFNFAGRTGEEAAEEIALHVTR